MRIKMITAQVSEGIDILTGYFSFFSNDLITYLQFFKIFFERMHIRLNSLCIGLVLLRNSSNDCWRTLHSYSLHIVLYTSNAAHFFTATCSSGSAMNEQR